MRWPECELKLLSDTNRSLDELHHLLPHRSKESIRIKACRIGWKRKGLALLRVSKNYAELLRDKKFTSIIDGELLGDGCIVKQRDHYIFSYCSSNHEYMVYLNKIITNKTGNKCKVYKQRMKGHFIKDNWIPEQDAYLLRIGHKVFESFYARWYQPQKHVPTDISLVPVSCLHWYIGDGSISCQRTVHIRLSTDCFARKDVEFLSNGLWELAGIEARIYHEKSNGHIIHLLGKNAYAFLQYIGDCPVPSYQYKWDTKGYKKYEAVCSECQSKFDRYGFVERNGRRSKCPACKG